MRIAPAISTALIAIEAFLVAGCKPPEKKAEAHPSPAKVDKVQQEAELNKIVLTAEAEQRLGLMLAEVETKPVNRVRNYGGEIALPPGASLVISAPVSGRVQPASAGNMPAAGMIVVANQPVLLLTPLLSPEREVLTPAERISIMQGKNQIATWRADAAFQVAQAQEQVNKAKLDLERAERLYRDSAGTRRAVEDAQSALNLANSALDAATTRQKLVESSDSQSESGQQTPLTIESPQAGMIRTASVAPGEVVAAGAPLFEVMKYDPVWVRVPVYAGETAQLALQSSAEVVPLNSERKTRGYVAKPIIAPPTATALSSTVDLYYELANSEGRLRPGERMTVRVKLQGASEQQVVPWAAVMTDINGGTWVYQNVGEHTYVRRRVQVRYILDSLAVLESGPATGAKIVTAGAVELYGTEMGHAK
ncbi:MAG: efflux RND transporter periplasmic adaptor subunit [Planctomycetia bacterium]|nr:efflux RND transporter periplasmic adaptor subunit [Planctomycetia bacterium]